MKSAESVTSTAMPLEALDDATAEPADLTAMLGRSRLIDRRLAQHPRAAAEMLELLARSADRGTRRNVASNPQTPKATLLRLAPAFPGEFFLNPVFDLLLLEDPTLLNELPASVFKNILRRPDCPASFLNWAASCGNAFLQLAVAGRADTPEDLLRRIASSRHVKAAELAAGRLLPLSTHLE